MTEQEIQQIIQKDFNGEDSPRVREQIARGYQGDTGQSAFELNRMEGESFVDYIDRKRRTEQAAEWNERQRQELTAEPKDSRLIALEQREQMYRDKASKPWATDREKQQHGEAMAELNDYRHEQAEIQQQAAQREYAYSDEHIVNLRENLTAIKNTASRRGDNEAVTEMIGLLNRLDQVTPASSKELLSGGWRASQRFEDRETSQLLAKESDANKTAADAVEGAAEAASERINAQQRASAARHQSEFHTGEAE